jgi:archaellum biogenesis ATPase FlaH
VNLTPFCDEKLHLYLSILSRDKALLLDSLDWLRPEDLEGDDPLPGIIAAKLQDFVRRYNRVPDRRELANDVEQEATRILPGANNGLGERHRAFVRSLYDGELPPASEVIPDLREFCRKRRVKAALNECASTVDEGGVDIVGKIKAAQQLGAPKEASLVYPAKIGEIEQEVATGKRAPTGFPSLDASMAGGLPVPGLGTFIGAPKGFKTTSMLRVSIGCLSRGLRVAYASLELSARIILLRLDSMLSGVPIKLLARGVRTEEAASKVKAFFRLTGGSLRVNYWPTRQATVDDLRSWLAKEEARDGWKPDVLVIDYADYLRAVGLEKHTEERFQQSTVYDQLRAFSSEIDAPLFTASLCNREGTKRTWIKLEHLAEAFHKAAVADILVAVCQSEHEARENRARLFVAGSRVSESGLVVPLKVRRSILRIDEAPELPKAE